MLVGACVGAVLAYAAIAFVAWDANPAHWEIAGRVYMVGLAALLAPLLARVVTTFAGDEAAQ